MSFLFQAYPLARQALFALDAEAAHETTLHALQNLIRDSFAPPFLLEFLRIQESGI